MKKKNSILLFPALLCLFFSSCGNNPTPVKEKFKVYFDPNHDGASSTYVEVESGSKVNKPSPDPIRTHYVFDKWRTGKESSSNEIPANDKASELECFSCQATKSEILFIPNNSLYVLR